MAKSFSISFVCIFGQLIIAWIKRFYIIRLSRLDEFKQDSSVLLEPMNILCYNIDPHILLN